MQDTDGDSYQHNGTPPEIPSINRNGKPPLEIEPLDNPYECYATQRSPYPTINSLTYSGCEEAHSLSCKHTFIRIMLRMKGGVLQHVIPSCTAFLSLTGVALSSFTNIEYYPFITQPITDYNTVNECLGYAEVSAKEIQEQYVINTHDLGVCMRTYPLLWNDPT